VTPIEVAVGLTIVLVTLWDAFETIVLPRTVRRRVRLTRFVVRAVWSAGRAVLVLPGLRRWREEALAFYGPLILLLLIATWAVSLIFGFGLMLNAIGSQSDQWSSFGGSLYLSGSSFFTLGLGDVLPNTSTSRVVVVVEAGTGFGFLALVIGYLPIIYQAFSRREVAISLLDARAGSPPTAVELIRRNGNRVAEHILVEWETWAADLLESHLSYPVLALFRSQHEKQSWLAALTVILDTCALIMTGLRDMPEAQAKFTFAMARHAFVDLVQLFFETPRAPQPDRLDHDSFKAVSALLETSGFGFIDETTAEATLESIRHRYEPIAYSLSRRLALELPPWLPATDAADDWQSSPWDILPPI
jgi:hypothetical protein